MSDPTRTSHGFEWGPAVVEALGQVERPRGAYRVVRVRTGQHTLDIYISPAGRSLRVFRDHVELKS